MNCVELTITGKVQGVWYRDYVRKTSVSLNLQGWVRNNLDGTVSAEVEGEEKSLILLIEKLKIGSPLSKVEDVQIKSLTFENKYKSFKILR